MKKTLFIVSLFMIVIAQSQEYSFIPKELTMISVDELMKKRPPTELELVYYEDGTQTTLDEVIPMIMEQKLTPQMFVDKDGEYKALVVVKSKQVIEGGTPVEIKINYKNIPERLSHLGYSFGNPESDTVIVNTQGGPMANLLTKEFETFFVENGGINPENTFVINVHQVHTLHPSWFNENDITHEQSIEYNKETTKILYDIVTYFKSQNKKVYVTGFSFGAFAGVDLLAEYGNIADGYLLMVGRLDMTEKVWKSFSNGIGAMFKEDGTEVIVDKKGTSVVENNLKKIASGLGHKRYTTLLKNTDLSNLIYVSGKKDQAVGRLTKKELDFLTSKKVNVITLEGGHESMGKYLKDGLKLLLNK